MHDNRDIVYAVNAVRAEVASLSSLMCWMAIGLSGLLLGSCDPAKDVASLVEACRSSAMASKIEEAVFTPTCMRGKGYEYRTEMPVCQSNHLVTNIIADCYERRWAWRTARRWVAEEWSRLKTPEP